MLMYALYLMVVDAVITIVNFVHCSQPAHLGSPGKRAVKWVCVCVCSQSNHEQ